MKKSELDWSYLARRTLIPVSTLLVSGLIFAACSYLLVDQRERFSQLNVDRDSISEDYDLLVYRRNLVNRYHHRYDQFQSLGFVGRESRLDWIDVMRLAAKNLRLPYVNYTVEPRSAVVAPVQTRLSGQDVQIFSSTLALEIGLLHELDLLRFFDRLQTEAPGLISIQRCSLARQGQGDAASATDANILATCSLKIYSVVTTDVSTEVAES